MNRFTAPSPPARPKKVRTNNSQNVCPPPKGPDKAERGENSTQRALRPLFNNGQANHDMSLIRLLVLQAPHPPLNNLPTSYSTRCNPQQLSIILLACCTTFIRHKLAHLSIKTSTEIFHPSSIFLVTKRSPRPAKTKTPSASRFSLIRITTLKTETKKAAKSSLTNHRRFALALLLYVLLIF